MAQLPVSFTQAALCLINKVASGTKYTIIPSGAPDMSANSVDVDIRGNNSPLPLPSNSSKLKEFTTEGFVPIFTWLFT